jgi:hypothetical protein
MTGLRALTILLLFYFVAGTMFLPEGDFSTLPDLPKMYADCKNFEDPDMNMSDFVTEHLFEINGMAGMFPEQADEPNERPHQPVQFHHQFVQISFVAKQLKIELQQPVVQALQTMALTDDVYLSDYTVSVFRPPIA